MPKNTRRLVRPRAGRLRTLISALLGAVLAIGGVLVVPVAASAAGPAVLSIEITPVNPATGETVTTTGYNQQNNRLGYRIAYSCSVAECTGAVVTLPAVALDPTYGTFRMHRYETWTPPAGGGATITNSVTAGVTVQLGTVAAGTSSTFLVQYVRDIDASAPGIAAPAYFPNGYQIPNSATITSPNAVAPATASAPPVTWQIALPANPTIAKTGPTTVRPDTDMTYSVAMSDGCFTNRGSGRWTAAGNLLCGESYTVVDHLPAQAQFVSAGDGGVYDAAAHTVTWTKSGATAAGGFGVTAFSGWSQGYGYNPRTVTVRYPASAFPEAADGADFVVPVTNNVDVSVTYLDDAATVKTAANSFTHSVVRVQPFGRADLAKAPTADQVAGGQRFVNVPPNTTGLVCPASGRDDWNRVCTPGQAVAPFTTRTDPYWSVDTNNRGNVPAVATIVDDDLGDSTLRVYRIETNSAATIAYTLSNGTTGTATGTSYAAPAGQRIVAATVTSGQLAGPNLLPSGTAGTLFRVLYRYEVPVGAPLGTWSNTATSTMTYTANPEIAPIVNQATGTATFRDWPKVAAAAPAFNAGFIGAPVVEGGGLVVPGGKVTFGVAGSTTNIPADRAVSPQYVFIAPLGWNVVPNSASFAAGAVPPGVSFTYKNVTIGGATRQAVIASWPTGATFGANATWPTMSVSASPTSAVAAGTNSLATVWAGDSRNAFDPDTTTWAGKVVDTSDLDGDGNVTEAFASSSTTVSVSGVSRLDVVKEICVVTDDGCTWVSNPDVVVGVNPDASDITYRVSLVNSGNTVLSGIVGYDILPHVGDGRGSTFAETLNTITSQSPNMTLSYSAAQNPCRAEVLPTNPGCATGWTGAASEAKAIRAQVSGNLAPGASSSFVFTANVVPGAQADAVACNSVAIDSASTLPAEPRPVCATTQEADLEVTVPDRLPLQAGRPGVVPFVVTNLGGSEAAPASVEISVPAGIRITSLTPEGWVCEADDVAADGSVLGPVTLTCDPVTADGASRMLVLDEPNALDLPAVIPDDELVGEETCFGAEVSGLMSDPVESNNADDACFVVAQGESLIGLAKSDGRDSVAMGEEFTYTIAVSNLLTGEALTDVAVTDTLPDTLAFVSASDGGTVADQGDADADGLRAGGTVTWNIDALERSGQVGTGEEATGGAGSTRAVTVTVRVVQAAETADEIVNGARAEAVDPALPGVTLSDDDSDTDVLIRTADLGLVKSASTATVSAVGDAVVYSFAVVNSGDVAITDVQIDETDFTGSGDALAVVCPAEAASLAPGDEVTCTASYEVTQADLDAGTIANTAVATGTAPAGLDAPESDESTATVGVDASPALVLEKTVTSEAIEAAGNEVTYNFAVTNTGNVTLDTVTITETAFSGTGDDVVPVCAEGDLAPGDTVDCTATYEVTQADVNAGVIDNTAIANAETPGGDDVTSDPSSVEVTIAAAPDLTVVKSASPNDLAVDEDVTYSFVVTNTGNVTLTDIEIEETAFSGSGDLSDIVCDDGASAVDPGEQVVCRAEYTITQDDVDAGTVDNTATASGVAPGGRITSDPSSVQLPFVAAPAISVVKSADVDQFTAADEAIEYRFLVTNTGNVTMRDIEVEEGEFSGSGELGEITCETGALLPGEQVLCTAAYETTLADVDSGQLANEATASAVAPAAEERTTSESSEVTVPFAGSVALALTKAGTPIDVDSDGRVTVADRIQWTFVVTNTGAATLRDVAVSDPMAGEVVCEATELAPGASTDCAATDEYQIVAAQATAGEVVNVAKASATGVGEVAVSSDQAQATVEVGVVIPPAADGGLATTGSDPRIAVLLGLFALLIGAGVFAGGRGRRERTGRV
ncbi:isopeptide-forming domain-containing fimbrial protein [Microbacterium sp. NPDC087665]|uniref:DUF7507 domain-containing protein n=1 Tax=Microbacterium sp. NPDC087665 TaxID=3364194 RepID=UPI0038153EE3